MTSFLEQRLNLIRVGRRHGLGCGPFPFIFLRHGFGERAEDETGGGADASSLPAVVIANADQSTRQRTQSKEKTSAEMRDLMKKTYNVDYDGDLEPIIRQRTSLYAATDEKHDAEAFAPVVAELAGR